MDLLLNPVILSVALLCALCLAKFNVLLAMIVSTILAGLVGGLPLGKTMTLLAEGFSGNATTALAYILLGTFAVAISQTGLMGVLVRLLGKHMGSKPVLFCLAIAFVSCLSQNAVPVHIAFIPLLIPPLLALMNRMRLDRRAISCALGFGLTAPYVALPVGFGLIFQGIVADNMTSNGMKTTVGDVASVAWILGLAMLVGLLVAVFVTYRRPRDYKAIEKQELTAEAPARLELRHWTTLLAIAVAVAVQLGTDSLPLAALMGLAIMLCGRVFNFQMLDELLGKGIGMMGYIAFVMLVAGGFAVVIKETGAVPALINSVTGIIGTSKLAAATLISVVGLLVTMGIGTSFGTIPVLAVIYVPLCQATGFSLAATALLIASAGALGDAGSPASDSTLGPTSGLNADGQHDHIWDTCVPTFLHYNIPLLIAGILGALVL
ncbi:MAG: TRAP transporter large permease subunit [Duodenibacillus sp.]|nr:TRAP transporter large permease subunit [Duodenibacillus sp.]